MAAIDTNASVAHRSAVALLRRLTARLAPAPSDPGGARTRGAFVRDMIARNPDAFSSDLDVQSMMQHYPGRF